MDLLALDKCLVLQDLGYASSVGGVCERSGALLAKASYLQGNRDVGRALRRIMVIEDNTFLALALEETLAHLGHRVTASAQRLDQALQLVEQAEFDCAIVDVDLHGQDAFPLLDRLRQRAIRYVLATGLPLSEIPEHYRRDVLVTKPYDVNELERAIARACAAY